MAGIEYNYRSFLTPNTWELLYKKGNTGAKIRGIIMGYIRRMILLTKLGKTDYVYIHREASPLGPPIFEWFIAKVLGKKIIYDFDDAIWLPNTSKQNRWAAWLKWHGKVKWICKWAYKVSCGNSFLAEYAQLYNKNTVVMPTVVDTRNSHVPRPKTSLPNVRIGWTGSHSTLPYLEPLVPVLQRLEVQCGVETIIIADQKPDLALSKLHFIPWNKESEIADLAKIDIGIMPLPNDDWAKGKCGFKAIQYQAMSIPSVVSPIGVNKQIVKNNYTGFWASTHQEWFDALSQLVQNESLRQTMGKAGRMHVETYYSVSATEDHFFELFS